MKLYIFPIAPNPTKVRLYLAEKIAGGAVIDLPQIMVDLREGEQKRPEHLARNPFGKLPVLELDDGSHLIESLAIIEYLEECHPEPPMIGRTTLERARMRELERIADLGMLLQVGRIIHATKSPLGLPPNPGVAESARAMLPDALRVLDDRMADGRPFVAGAAPGIADCTLASAFQFARFGGVEIPADFQYLTRWDAAYRARPAAQQVLLA
ncbi:MAG: glutathione S-transferase family protein [Deltaproteobacteria bacterium]|nr:glutathione S-transferase family protein [Deltaproteobacteria bacterium]